MKYLMIISCLLFSSSFVWGQEDSELVEVYGMIMTQNDQGRFEYVPFATIGVEGTSRGTYANYEGMYSIVVKKGQQLKITAVGQEDRVVKIPEDIVGMYYSLTVELKSAPINLEEVTVFPWPDRNNFAAEFLAMKPNRALQLESIAKDNLDKNRMMAIAASTDPDGKESASYYLQKQSSEYSYQGQVAPQSIFDPLAWSKFFKQWKKKGLSEKEKKMLEMLENESGGGN